MIRINSPENQRIITLGLSQKVISNPEFKVKLFITFFKKKTIKKKIFFHFLIFTNISKSNYKKF